MPAQSVLRWLDGRGWLVLSGGADDDVRAAALGRAAADGGVACVALSGDPDALLDDIIDLGAPSGYIVDVFGEDDQSLREKLAEAGMVIVVGGSSVSEVRGALQGVALEGIQAAYENGAIILLEHLSAIAFSAWLVGEMVESGLGWLETGAVVTGVTNAASYAKPIFEVHADAVAVAIQVGSALALGPDGQVETWGRREVTIELGTDYGTFS
jgi:hypothetical protein